LNGLLELGFDQLIMLVAGDRQVKGALQNLDKVPVATRVKVQKILSSWGLAAASAREEDLLSFKEEEQITAVRDSPAEPILDLLDSPRRDKGFVKPNTTVSSKSHDSLDLLGLNIGNLPEVHENLDLSLLEM
jgi:hypothetical protein